jgi:hypothetical protein
LNPEEFWTGLEPDQKLALKQAIFPEGGKDRDDFIGTEEKSSIFSALSNNQRAEAKMASPRGFEPLLPP